MSFILLKEKKNSQDQDTWNCTNINTSIIKHLLTPLTADPPSSRPNGLFFLFFLHVVPVFTGFQLPILPPLRQAMPGLAPSLQTGSIFPWIQVTARCHVGQTYRKSSKECNKTSVRRQGSSPCILLLVINSTRANFLCVTYDDDIVGFLCKVIKYSFLWGPVPPLPHVTRLWQVAALS